MLLLFDSKGAMWGMCIVFCHLICIAFLQLARTVSSECGYVVPLSRTCARSFSWLKCSPKQLYMYLFVCCGGLSTLELRNAFGSHMLYMMRALVILCINVREWLAPSDACVHAFFNVRLDMVLGLGRPCCSLAVNHASQ